MKRLAIIDADSVLYAVALSAEMCCRGQGMEGQDLWLQVRDAEDCYQEVLTKLDALVDIVGASDGIICLTDGRCFRYDVLPTYKANRERTRRPPMAVTLRTMVLHRKPFRMVRAEPTLEADDMCGIASTALQRGTAFEPVIVSEDKDMLTIPGLLYRQGRMEEVSLEEADRAHLYQTLTGDVVDGYKGCPGVGSVKANRLLDNVPKGEPPWSHVVAAFTNAKLTEEDALQQARVARILRTEDWNASTREVRLWTP